jgi:hypothetical protein
VPGNKWVEQSPSCSNPRFAQEGVAHPRLRYPTFQSFNKNDIYRIQKFIISLLAYQFTKNSKDI